MTEEYLNAEDFQKEEKIDNINYLSGMYKDWFLDYASYVILERAVPYVNDGLKPVQRRILHAMKVMDDGRYNKVANIIGQTMQYHPHGDASIGDALVQLGQKDLLIDCQGNWGNILTGDGAAAPRYIEARLSKFALEVLFNPKTTNWKLSYDGRNKEPITLPVKFPLLLAQGVEGIAVGLASKILPHNFIELIDACIAHLKEEDFEIFPDFPTGGSADFSKYNDGLRGGNVKVRAKIEKKDNKTLVVTEVPFGKTTGSLIETILKANEKGKIKIRKIDDNTAENVEILIHLAPGISSDKTIDALYAFTDCEVSISPNCCIIRDDKPHFIGVNEILRINVDNTVQLLKLELEIRKSELEESWHFSSLEKIFIEERIYKDKKFEDSVNMDAAIDHIDERLEPWKPKLKRDITRDDILKLMEIKMARILKFNKDKADEHLQAIEDEIAEIVFNIENIIPFTIKWYKQLKSKYSNGKERRTEIRSFENIEAVKVVVANEKLYIDREEGFVGTGLKKSEYICDCSDIDDIIIFRKDGTYVVAKVTEKAFFGKNILHVAVFKKNDKRTIYNIVYRDGKNGVVYMKRFPVTGVTRDKEYDLTQGTPGSKIMYFSENPNGEAEVLKVTLKPKPRIKKLVFEVDFGDLAIKGRAAMGNILSKNEVHKIVLKEKGVSTLGGRKIWFDEDVLRLNSDGRGKFLGEFLGEDSILVLYKNGEYQLYNFDLSNHFDDGILIIEKFDPRKILSAIYLDNEQGFYYVKRFQVEEGPGKRVNFVGEVPDNKLVSITWVRYPRFEIEFGGKNGQRENEIIEVDEFIGIKSYKAKGKRLTNYEVENIKELEPVIKDEDIKEPEVPEEDDIPDNDIDEIPFEINRPKDHGPETPNQMSLF
ncbi:MAG: DNA topoisomerase IV [Bacteroidetes bacterium GWF2_42_66]|nr:MAG: DNA topoisomerase IV [Bacteroidetes bacterium GWA2_42_15]OFY01479.1 MAG: DNA topoisomerase IV [Bacteroidetes bacterium GWE2_42_39]OFY43340.1 MAG: DNA topoisomerase IV [Bacteroidetes bacterium GWF2_42_66]HBL77477.1 DNA gyrase/topoisomerase IV subunit A [Prolixibacteraceae bacterium]HCR91298.1 DNA gyrase/topoisomerase IV subunit A [Prolixibacteraceae bacterium]